MEGDEIIVTWGKESYWPTRSFGFDIGPFSITTRVQQGETAKEAFKRAWKTLDANAKLLYMHKREGFHERARNAGQ